MNLREAIGSAFRRRPTLAGFETTPVVRSARRTTAPRRVRSVWRGAMQNRLTADWVAQIMHVDDETRMSLSALRARGRELVRNNGYAKQYTNLLSVMVIGPKGFMLQAHVKNRDGRMADRINDSIEFGFRDWSLNPTLAGGMSRVRLEHLLLKTVATDGEAWVRKWRGPEFNPYGFALEPFDADAVDENMDGDLGNGRLVRQGIEFDERTAAPVAVYVRPPESTRFGGFGGTPERIPFDEIIHLYDPLRVRAIRGITWFHSVMIPLRMLEAYIETELVASRIASGKMGVWKKTDPQAVSVESSTDEEGNEKPVLEEADPGTFDYGPDGYELQMFDPQHPNNNFPGFVKAALRTIATGLGVSYNALANDLEGVNYSSMRSGILIERDVYRCLQQWWMDAWYRPVYREWLNMSLLTGAVQLDTRDVRKFLEVEWTPRGYTWVDPLKDSQAGLIGIRNGLTSRTRLAGEQGVSVEQVLRELKAEEELAAQLGVKISGDLSEATPVDDEDDDEEPDDDEENESNGTRNGLAPRRAVADAMRGTS